MGATITLHAEIAAEALKRREEYALRAWYYVRAASNGQGHCRLQEFRGFLKRHGFRRPRIETIIQDLLASGMASRSHTKYGDEVLLPLPTRDMMARYGLAKMRLRVAVPLAELKGKGVRSLLAGYLQIAFGDTPRARDTFAAITGVAKSTQRRGEKRLGVRIRENYIRGDASTIDRMPCVAEGHEGHRTYRDNDSVYVQAANSYSHPTIARRKRVVHGICSNCGEKRAPQETHRRRYHTNMRKAAKQRDCRVPTPRGELRVSVVVAEGTKRLGKRYVGVWEVV